VYRIILKPLLFLMTAEKAHHFTFKLLSILSKVPLANSFLRLIYQPYTQNLKPIVVAGISFPHAVGLAAGFDKDAKLINTWAHLGFSFVEIGTVTPIAQPGNDKPRLFRLKKDEAIINRMGFNNQGSKAAAQRLRNRKNKTLIIGGNIGKNKITPNEEAVNDYLICFNDLYEEVDYFVVNVSSPNTPNLRALQDKAPLKALLLAVQALNNTKPKQKPVFLKIAPDLTDTQLDDIIDIVNTTKIAGIIATNTTISREQLKEPKENLEAIGMGGLSGKPLTKRSTEVIRYLHTKSNGVFPIIGVGGIHSPEDAKEKLAAGASLIQLYTGYIYEGPGLVKQIVKKLKSQ
jgi:dihydroorotate dehydrogenase